MTIFVTINIHFIYSTHAGYLADLAVPALDSVGGLYTLNFENYSVAFCSYFLRLFPVFVLR